MLSLRNHETRRLDSYFLRPQSACLLPPPTSLSRFPLAPTIPLHIMDVNSGVHPRKRAPTRLSQPSTYHRDACLATYSAIFHADHNVPEGLSTPSRHVLHHARRAPSESAQSGPREYPDSPPPFAPPLFLPPFDSNFGTSVCCYSMLVP